MDFFNQNAKIDEIKKELENYLEEKRRSFPRFYFLSNPDLLSLLSNQSDPKKIEIHLNKCFENIVKLNQDDSFSLPAFKSMISAEGEVVEFNKIVKIEKSGQGVEIWLREVMNQDVLKKKLSEQMEKINEQAAP